VTITFLAEGATLDTLNTRVVKADTVDEKGGSYVTPTQRKADSTYRAAQDVAIRAVQAADSAYKVAQIALKVAKADTTTEAGGSYVTPTQRKADSTYRAAQDVAIRAVIEADSLYRVAQEAAILAVVEADTLFRAAQEAAIRAIQAADSSYKTDQIALKQNILVSDTASFTTTATRLAVYLAGTTGASIFSVNIRGQADVLPVADDIVRYQPVTDSLVVTRAVGTTSGLQISWTKLK